MKRILIIGGTDSSGGAGLSRDVAVTHDYGCIGLPVVTCVTAQTSKSVELVHEVPPMVLHAQIRAALSDIRPDAIKIGMVGSRKAADIISSALNNLNTPTVLDPVLRATSGGKLAEDGAIDPLMSLASLITPNIDEAAVLSGYLDVEAGNSLLLQASAILSQGSKAVLIKGGHASGEHSCDHLFDHRGHQAFCLPRLPKNKRGTGCSLATAIACELALGNSLAEACNQAKAYLHDWIAD